MTNFDRFKAAIDDASSEIDRHSHAFARIQQQRLDIDDAAFRSDDPAGLLMAAASVVARQAAADFVAMNRPCPAIADEEPVTIDFVPTEAE